METSQSTTPQLSSSTSDLVDSAALVDISTKVKVSYFEYYIALQNVATPRINHLQCVKIEIWQSPIYVSSKLMFFKLP